MRLQVSNNAVTGWLQLAGDASIFIMNEQLYPVGFVLEGHARCLFMRFAHWDYASRRACALLTYALRLFMAFGHRACTSFIMCCAHWDYAARRAFALLTYALSLSSSMTSMTLVPTSQWLLFNSQKKSPRKADLQPIFWSIFLIDFNVRAAKGNIHVKHFALSRRPCLDIWQAN